MKLTTVECVEACPLALDKHAVLLQHGDVVLGAPLGNHVVAECEEQVSNLAIGFVTTGLEADYRFTNFNIGVENCGIRSNLLRDNISLEENVAYSDESLVPHLEMSTRDRLAARNKRRIRFPLEQATKHSVSTYYQPQDANWGTYRRSTTFCEPSRTDAMCDRARFARRAGCPVTASAALPTDPPDAQSTCHIQRSEAGL
jgi:hypothetical protein